MMKLLMLFPSLKIKSEWIFRLIENLGGSIAVIGTNEINTERIKTDQLNINPFYSKILRRINEDLNSNFTYPTILLKAEKKENTNINYIHFIGYAIKFKTFIRKSKNPTLIHCHGKDVMWDLKDIRTGIPVHPPEYFKSLEELSKDVYFIANSQFTRKQLLKKGVDESRIFINHFGIEIKEKLITPINNKTFKILYLGRLVDFKGPLETIEAFERACQLGLKGELLIAGGGEMEDQCREKINQSKYKDRIKLLGWVNKEEAETLYQQCNIFTAHNKVDAYTNQVEAFGVTIIEAMSFGLPVVTGKCGGVEDSVVDGVTGFLIEPGDIGGHAEKLIQLYNDFDLRSRLSANSVDRIKDHFSLEKERNGLENIIKKISNKSTSLKNA
ncbi:glycosyltransferase family 4 protein [Christiangramia sabulilitoris]|uniref:Glycosyltransferase family 4 protein n=1 Tax=Christiangramia sabulilitoris TaxID=2583991 RepID=A0A550I2D3_9FLAO|nr:glycosyltransferase family 4 protein [Christiangramia sabulilitoris]TRO65111.1 glycosyltransferase family 4 protein [Christiangramia sabulilitoris]